MNSWIGLGGAARNGCVALRVDDGILGVCEQERITRVRAAGFNASGLPDEALDELLGRAGRHRDELVACALAERVAETLGAPYIHLEHHFAHACSAFLPSPFDHAAIVVCDHEEPYVSVWEGRDAVTTAVEWPWRGPGFAEVYSRCAEALGFVSDGREQRMEALARLSPHGTDGRVADLFALDLDRLRLAHEWQRRIRDIKAETADAAPLAAAMQSRIGDLLVDFLAHVKRRTPARHLCVGGSLFYNSHLNARVKRSGLFDDVFVPVNPGNGGLAVGTALEAVRPLRCQVPPFLGPAYSSEEIKATLDNCKLNYEWASEADIVSECVDALLKGRLLGWFEGAMEWGPRALGARSIIANPFAPYVLDNLNRFLKQREPWRGYALSVSETALHQHFDGPAVSPHMECDYMPKSPESFRHILPGPSAALRIHSVGSDTPPLFRSLLDAFGEASGMPIVVNTSFNGFREPIVCNPRDAVRVFFGTGLDVLALGRFIIRK